MGYEKLSKRALKCMYASEIVSGILILLIIGLVNYLWFFPKDIGIGKLISLVCIAFCFVSMAITPYFKFNRYRYSITDECIDIKEGYLFVKRHIVPIERIHKLETSKGPLDQMFYVAKVTVTTAGGDVTLRFLDEEKAEKIAESLRTRINEIVKEQREKDGAKK